MRTAHFAIIDAVSRYVAFRVSVTLALFFAPTDRNREIIRISPAGLLVFVQGRKKCPTGTLFLTDELYGYIRSVSLREPEILRRLREETSHDPMAGMQISPEQGQFMSLLIKLLGAKRTLEVGVFTGYNSLCVALALPRDGQLIACDISKKWTDVARRYWREGRVADIVELHLAPAIETMDPPLAQN